MPKPACILLLIILYFSSCGFGQSKPARQVADTVTRIEMSLSAFGVESDNFPSIDVSIDFVNGSSKCAKSYYNPAFKPTTYSLTVEEMRKISLLINNFDLTKLKAEYTVSKTDQPTSTTIIYTGGRKFVIKDYGLVGQYPLQELYKIAYRL